MVNALVIQSRYACASLRYSNRTEIKAVVDFAFAYGGVSISARTAKTKMWANRFCTFRILRIGFDD